MQITVLSLDIFIRLETKKKFHRVKSIDYKVPDRRRLKFR
jgi:hypothetical protein